MLNQIKNQFPIFTSHPDLVYVDNAATTQVPQSVIDAVGNFEEISRANVHRGVYALSARATELYEGVRGKVATLINAIPEEIIFTSGTTQGLNLLAQTIGSTLAPGDNVVLTRMEHHANLVPWQQMAKRYGFELRFIDLTPDFGLQTSALPIDKNTKVVSMVHVSNSLGTINPVKEIFSQAKEVGAITILDAAQSIAHMPIDVQDLGCDALAFSGHKMYGPTGIGVLYLKKKLGEQLPPFLFGGDMIQEVSYESASWNQLPYKFEAGTPNISGAIGLGAAIDFIQSIGFVDIQKHEEELTSDALAELEKIDGVKIIGPYTNRVGVISFVMKGVHPHDIATILDRHGVAIRVGHHCTMPLMRYLGINGTARASFGLYNTKEDVDRLITGVREVKKIFG